MNKEMFLSLIPTVVVTEEDVKNRIEAEQKTVDAGRSFAAHLSINRFLYKKLTDFSFEERLNLFTVLSNYGFVYMENGLYWHQLDMDSFVELLKEKFNTEDIYTLDNVYLENLLKGNDITEEMVNIDAEDMSFYDVLDRFVFSTGGMTDGDTPPLSRMLVAKKALLGTYLAEKNVESLLNGHREIYDISVLH